MIGQITKIDQMKASRNSKEAFVRVYFKLQIESKNFIWAKTDLVPTFRNYKKWKPLLKVGNILDGLILRGKETIDADSNPIFLKNSEVKNFNSDPVQLDIFSLL